MIHLTPILASSWPQSQGCSVFETLFQPILEALPPLYWIVWNYEGGPFDSLASEVFDDEWLEGLFVELNEVQRNSWQIDVRLLRPTYLPTLSRYIYNDWVNIVGVPGEEHEARTVAQELIKAEWSRTDSAPNTSRYISSCLKQKELIERHGEIFLHCHDGSWWKLHLRQSQVQAQARRHLQKLGGLRVEEISFDGLY